jgi:hypothetical protein
MAKYNRTFFIITFFLLIISSITNAQVNSVVFGRNRVQYKKFKWQYYQTKNFNTYFNQDGQELAKFIAQVAEEELPQIEKFTELPLQRRANLIVYNSYADYAQTNIGLGTDEPSASGVTKLVNNKMVVYFNGDHANLRKQVREGIARILIENALFGDDLGEFAGNQTLLNLPKWLTEGYVTFAGENWNTALDDELKSEILSEKYKNFYAFAFDKPELAGHAFWYYIEERYKKENTTYLLYLAKVYKNLNKACKQVCKKKFKEVLADFMEYEENKYENDIKKRKPYPKGTVIESFEIDKQHDYYRINVNPNKHNNSYALVEYKKGIVRLKLNQDDEVTTLLKYGILSYQNETDPNYPIIAWDPKGTRLAVIYSTEGKLQLFVYDLITRIKPYSMDLTDTFNMVQDVKYMLDSRTLVLSAVKNGHSDIYTIDLENQKIHQVTNDVYDDLDPSFVSFPNKTGIIFSSNRPSPDAKNGDTVLPSKNRYNIFLITNYGGKPELNQITQLSNLKYGDARFPTQYNNNHFTFISDENGVGNRYAGFFTTKTAGLDTLVLIGDNILRNPSPKEVDSALVANKKTDVDSIAVIAVSEDSAYTFPITNYESSVAETRVAGDNSQVSEVTRESDEKILYKLKIDENVLHRRNVTVPPTEYMKRVVMADKITEKQPGKFDRPVNELQADSSKKQKDIFQNEFENEKQDSSLVGKVFSAEDPTKETILKKAKLYVYKPVKFYVDYGSIGLDNNVLFDQYQKYQNGQGPIQMGSSTPINAQLNVGTSELMEDQKLSGAIRLSTDLTDKEYLLSYQNYKRRFDWGLTYYRNVLGTFDDTITIIGSGGLVGLNTKTITDLGQFNIAYPFDRARRISLSLGVRNDRIVYTTEAGIPQSLYQPDVNQTFATSHMEYVFDNTLNPAQNIWHGLRYKFFIDWNTDISKAINNTGKFNFNWGFDARDYRPIYRNFIWAGRIAGAFSWGSQKTIYYVGGEDGWFNPQFNNNKPAPDQTYAFQALAINLRGFNQNVANGNNSIIINSEFRLPVVTTFFNRPVNNAFLNNFQLIQFIDLGNAWNGKYNSLSRPTVTYGDPSMVQVVTKAGGIGPLAGGYGFGARSSLLGYFLKVDVAWPMVGIFRGTPMWYFSMGLDF